MTQETNDNVFYSGNGTVGRENMTAPTGYFFQMPKREWVGLTDEEVKDIVWNLPYEPSQEHIRAIEAKLREKNT
jgi:hypothetical protein